jgi:hypothetical protein
VTARFAAHSLGLSPEAALGYGLPNTGAVRLKNGVETYLGE